MLRLILIIFLLAFSSFTTPLVPAQEAPKSDDNTIGITLPSGKVIRSEVALTPQQRQLGLMFRPSMPEDHGMLFIFDLPGAHAFWMKSTLMSLDIIWMDKNKQIVYIASHVPPCKMDPCPQYGSKKKGSLYVLEVNAGKAEEWGLKVGSTLQF